MQQGSELFPLNTLFKICQPIMTEVNKPDIFVIFSLSECLKIRPESKLIVSLIPESICFKMNM